MPVVLQGSKEEKTTTRVPTSEPTFSQYLALNLGDKICCATVVIQIEYKKSRAFCGIFGKIGAKFGGWDGSKFPGFLLMKDDDEMTDKSPRMLHILVFRTHFISFAFFLCTYNNNLSISEHQRPLLMATYIDRYVAPRHFSQTDHHKELFGKYYLAHFPQFVRTPRKQIC